MSSVFLSHNYKDKVFARKLASHLKIAGVRVWLDEAELKLGDSLIEKLSTAIKKMNYLAVLLSKNSVSSKWVKKEVNIALNEEICGRKVKVLPLVIENCSIPFFLRDKLYADFTKPENYINSLQLLLDRILQEKVVDAKLILQKYKQLEEIKKIKQVIFSLLEDEKLIKYTDTVPDILVPRAKKIKEICDEISEIDIYIEYLNVFLEELKNEDDIRSTAIFYICNEIFPSCDLDKYLISNFYEINSEVQGIIIESLYIDINPNPNFLNLIENLIDIKPKNLSIDYLIKIRNSILEK
ncbi:MAG: toll/interleukin-1 receptor domain-containing protein [Candidatus Hodarchaeota archaeon]